MGKVYLGQSPAERHLGSESGQEARYLKRQKPRTGSAAGGTGRRFQPDKTWEFFLSRKTRGCSTVGATTWGALAFSTIAVTR